MLLTKLRMNLCNPLSLSAKRGPGSRIRFCFLAWLAGSLAALLLSACGGGGGAPGEPGPPAPPPATTGALAVSATGLPTGINPALRVSGPGNYRQDLTQNQTLNDLAPGSYTVTAAPVIAGGLSYQPAPA